MSDSVAIVGMGCVYADAASPEALWENVLAQRRAFRRLPPERLNLDDYGAADRTAVDRTYATWAAVLENYAFDRVRFRVSGDAFRSADVTHWLALDVADRALRDAGVPNAEGLPRASTGVVVGNTLTGEFSRAGLTRLRWPYVRRTVDAALAREGWTAARRQSFLSALEPAYKAPFPPPGPETLAGGLSNTIAGRICNHFDLHGGGYTVDGACASSLLAVIHACRSLVAGDLDVALAGGVDLSLDPFELVGFARVGALAERMMRVYDARAEGFWPGEGGGFLVLMRHADAVRRGRRVYAVIRGWGMSSDGAGGITRPKVDGQLLAVQRAWRHAGLDAATAAYFEGHGTGTRVGDAVELDTLAAARRTSSDVTDAPPAVVGSVKANVGHTKAAAGVTGIIKATMALHRQILPPNTACDTPNEALTGSSPALRVLARGQRWPTDRPLRAGVSAMGFGGINTHLVLENPGAERVGGLSARERTLLASAQDAEILLLAAETTPALREQVDALATLAPTLSLSELTDLSAALVARLPADRTTLVRAAVVASTPAELTDHLRTLSGWLDDAPAETPQFPSASSFSRIAPNVAVGRGVERPRVGFLFPGQSAPSHRSGGRWRHRFAAVDALYDDAALPATGDDVATEVAQPCIVTASTAALRVLNRLGVTASVAVGHSLGELSALFWAGAFGDGPDGEAALRALATARGRAMASLGDPTGTMASVAAPPAAVEALIDAVHATDDALNPLGLAGLNGPQQTVVSGARRAVACLVDVATERGLQTRTIPVSHAFHSPLVSDAAAPLADVLHAHPLGAVPDPSRPASRVVASTVTGTLLRPDDDLAALLVRQVTAPVRFADAVAAATTTGVDLWIEAGPGRVLTGLVGTLSDAPVVATDAGGDSLRGLLQAVGAAFALGALVEVDALFDGRFARPFDLDRPRRFLANPCEAAPAPDPATASASAAPDPLAETPPSSSFDVPASSHGDGLAASPTAPTPSSAPDAAPIDVVRRLVAERAELPEETVRNTDRMLSDLHLNSITVGELVNEAARVLGLAASTTPTAYANASLVELAEALTERARLQEPNTNGESDSGQRLPPDGLDAWIRPFDRVWVPRPHPPTRFDTEREATPGAWTSFVADDHPLDGALRDRFGADRPGSGVVVALSPDAETDAVPLVLQGVHAALDASAPGAFVLVHHGAPGAALARTLHLEAPGTTVCVVEIPPDPPDALAWVVADVDAALRAGPGFTEARYDARGRRFVPRLRLCTGRPDSDAPSSSDAFPLDASDVVLVTGGGKGITAACTLALGRASGAAFVLLGRSAADDDDVAATLDRMTGAGLRVRYVQADVTDPAAVRAAVRVAADAFGPVTAIVHGAARNVPCRLSDLTVETVRRTFAPKVDGLRHLLDAVDAARLHLLVSFGSIIGRMGLPGAGDYALANEALERLTTRWGAAHPHCRCLTVEWSIWSDVGMGARLGSVDALTARGITPIAPDVGTDLLLQLLDRLTSPSEASGSSAESPPPTSVVVTGRYGDLPTLRVEQPTLPFLRFVERPRAWVPGVELIADVDLSPASDPYLDDHALDGERLLPAVMGLEAMVQAACAVTQTDPAGPNARPRIDNAAFPRPIVVPTAGGSPLRVIASVVRPGRVSVALRCASTDFQVDHFRATCRFDTAPNAVDAFDDIDGSAPDASIPLDPAVDVYGPLLFHRGRFRRVAGYRRLRATACVADVTPDDDVPWFERTLPPTLVLGDVGARDAAIHAIQACIPHATILPVGVDRLTVVDSSYGGPRCVDARERHREGDRFVYDVVVSTPAGRVLERWDGLVLHRVRPRPLDGPWPGALLVPYLERRVNALLSDANVALTLVAGRDDAVTDDLARRRAHTDAVFHALLGDARPIRREGGRPTVDGAHISAAHAGPWTLAVAAEAPVGCDLERVATRSATIWRGLIGAPGVALARQMASDTGEPFDVAATRVWTTREALSKSGASLTAPLTLHAAASDGWVVLASARSTIATASVAVRPPDAGRPDAPLVVAVTEAVLNPAFADGTRP